MTRSDKDMMIATILSGVFTMLIMSVMGWLILTWPEPAPAPKLVYDTQLVKQGITENQARAMAEATAIFNKNMELRARGQK